MKLVCLIGEPRPEANGVKKALVKGNVYVLGQPVRVTKVGGSISYLYELHGLEKQLFAPSRFISLKVLLQVIAALDSEAVIADARYNFSAELDQIQERLKTGDFLPVLQSLKTYANQELIANLVRMNMAGILRTIFAWKPGYQERFELLVGPYLNDPGIVELVLQQCEIRWQRDVFARFTRQDVYEMLLQCSSDLVRFHAQEQLRKAKEKNPPEA